MIKKIIIFYLFFISVNLFAQSGKATMPDVFYKCWTASFEEDAKSANVFETFRTCNFKEFKTGMFRKKMEFFKNGTCKWLQIAANDAHFFVDAKWVYKHGKIIIRNNKKETLFKFKIEHLEGNRMNIMPKG